MLALAQENLYKDGGEQIERRGQTIGWVRAWCWSWNQDIGVEEKSEELWGEKSAVPHLGEGETNLGMELNAVERRSLEKKTKLCGRIRQLQKA